MSSEPVIVVQNLSKVYRIYERPEHRLIQMASLGRVRRYKEFTALQDVTLEIGRGETVGIVGRNGCGKSTLLQIICGTLQPTGGRVEVAGRIAALLELGAGFNGEFTGRENVYMNGAILGLGRGEMDARFDEIAKFADIGDFIERPVKTYSSGMFVRLAFAVAIAVEPDILIIDEALAVGDEAFQRKCYARIEAIKERGGTILFVSHASQAILQLCDRAVLFDAGQKLLEGEPKTVVSQYQRLLNLDRATAMSVREDIRSMSSQPKPVVSDDGGEEDLKNEVQMDNTLISQALPAEWYDPGITPQSTVSYDPHGARIMNAFVATLDGQRVNVIRARHRYRFCYDVTIEEDCRDVGFGMLIKSVSGLEIGGADSFFSKALKLEQVKSPATFHIEFEFECVLTPGIYFLNAGVHGTRDGTSHYLHRVLDIASFRVISDEEPVATALVNIAAGISIVPVETNKGLMLHSCA